MYETILLPTDGSRATNAVVDHALDVAVRRDATVHVLFVVDDRAFLTLEDSLIPEVTERLTREGERATGDAAESFESAGIEATTGIRTGDPADEIAASIDEIGADLVVMGTHGADPARNLLGSTTQKLISLSPVSVLSVAVGDDERGRPESDARTP